MERREENQTGNKQESGVQEQEKGWEAEGEKKVQWILMSVSKGNLVRVRHEMMAQTQTFDLPCVLIKFLLGGKHSSTGAAQRKYG